MLLRAEHSLPRSARPQARTCAGGLFSERRAQGSWPSGHLGPTGSESPEALPEGRGRRRMTPGAKWLTVLPGTQVRPEVQTRRKSAQPRTDRLCRPELSGLRFFAFLAAPKDARGAFARARAGHGEDAGEGAAPRNPADVHFKPDSARPLPAWAHEVRWVNKRVGVPDEASPAEVPNPIDCPDAPESPIARRDGEAEGDLPPATSASTGAAAEILRNVPERSGPAHEEPCARRSRKGAHRDASTPEPWAMSSPWNEAHSPFGAKILCDLAKTPDRLQTPGSG